MFPLSPDTHLLLAAGLAIVTLVVLISALRLHPFLALILASALLGLTAEVPAEKLVPSFQKGFGDVMGFVGIVLGLGTMLGKLMAVSGGADQIAETLVDRFGLPRLPWSMVVVAFLVGIPMFFEVGFVLLLPLVFAVGQRARTPWLRVGIPLLAGLSVVHGLVPPHPGPLLAIDALKADVGRTILYGLIVGVPTAVVAGPLFGELIARRVQVQPNPELIAQLTGGGEPGAAPAPVEAAAPAPARPGPVNRPGFGLTVATILLPVVLMLGKSVGDVGFPKDHPVHRTLDLVGHPITALVLAVLFALFSFGFARGFSRAQILGFLNQSLVPTAGIILIIGAGGGFKQMLVDCGVGKAIGALAAGAHLSPLLLGWLVAALIRVATGSATVATVTGVGIMAPLIANAPGTSTELLVLAIGAGSLFFSHVNDAGFWMVKEYFGMSVGQTFASWTVMETLISVVALLLILLLGTVVR